MILRFPMPRWLPATIGVIAGLLAVKSVTLVRAVTTPHGGGDISFLSSNASAADAKLADGKPADAKPVDAKPADAKPADPKAAQAPPVQPPAPPA